MEILSPGEKVKQLRKDIGLKQDDITDNQITRSLISMIENEKRILSPQTAKIIARKLNQYYKHVGKIITADYLMESKEAQVQRIIVTQLESLEELIKRNKQLDSVHVLEIFDSLMALATQWSMKYHYSMVLMKRGDFYYQRAKYNRALMDFFNCLEHFLESKSYVDASRIYSRIGSCYLMKLFIDEALLYYNRAFAIAAENNLPNLKRIKMLTLYNSIICHRKVKKYDMVLQFVQAFKELNYPDVNAWDQVIMMEANTYRDLENFDKAEALYEKLLAKESELSSNTLALTYNNLSVLYRKMDHHDQALVYANKTLDLMDCTDTMIPPFLLCELAECYRDLKQPSMALSLLHRALEIAEESGQVENIIDIYLLLSEIHQSYFKDLQEAEAYLMKANQIVNELGIRSKYSEINYKIVSYYFNTNQLTQCKKYLDLVSTSSINIFK